MAKREKRRIVLSDYKAKAKDRYIELVGDDGVTYKAMPAELWPDDVFHLIAKDDLIGAAETIMEDYAGFSTTGGGSAALLFSIVKDREGLEPGE